MYRALEAERDQLKAHNTRVSEALGKARKRARALEVALADLVQQCNNRVPGDGGVDTEAAEELLKPS